VAIAMEGPRRIVCLTEETTETLYLLGKQDRIVGVSGFTCRPPEARKKPHVSAFTSAKTGKIIELKPDLVIGFSNLQAEIARELIREGLNVLVFNQRSVEEIFGMMAALARLVGAEARGLALVERLLGELDRIGEAAARFPKRPRVFFEEWMDPLISGIRWVDELLEIAGGAPIFAKLREEHDARRRIVAPEAVAERDAEVIFASWCGRKVNKNVIRNRAGWQEMAAVRNGHIYEIKSTYILQPGPAALTEGVRQMHAILARVAGGEAAEGLGPEEAMDGAFAGMRERRKSYGEERGRAE
jgi:iron complex transport system substrate-binding protein